MRRRKVLVRMKSLIVYRVIVPNSIRCLLRAPFQTSSLLCVECRGGAVSGCKFVSPIPLGRFPFGSQSVRVWLVDMKERNGPGIFLKA